MQTLSKDIVVIDPSGLAGAAACFFRLGEIHMSDVKSMVANVYARMMQNKADIRGLRINDHGNDTGMEFGTDFVTTANFMLHSFELDKLKGAFCPYNGFVHLLHCEAGQNTALMAKFAALWKVPVYGGVWYTSAATGLNFYAYEFKGLLSGQIKAIPNPFGGFQQWVRVDPNGTVTRNVSVP